MIKRVLEHLPGARSFGLAALGAAVMASTGCGSGAPAAGDTTVEIFSWWVSGSETQALAALLDVYEKANPRATVINAAVTGTADAETQLQQRMVQGLPPDTFQANAGDELLQWVVYNDKDDTASKLEPIESLGNTAEWLKVVPASVTDLVTYNSHVYAVPLDVSRTNCLFYNKKIFTDNGLTPPQTIADFITVADALQAKGITPLAVGSHQPWTLATLVWESVLVASAGPQYYLDFFSGRASASDAQLRTALNDAAKMLTYINADHDTLLWNDAIELVRQGKAAMNIMGDWAKGELIAKGAVPNVDFGEVSLGDGAFVYAMDVFPLPRGAPNRSGAIALLSTMGSLAGQNAFNPTKGSIPTRTDVDTSVYDPIAKQTLEDFKTKTLVPANSSIVPVAFTTPTDAALASFVNDSNVDNMILAVRNYYDLLKPPL